MSACRFELIRDGAKAIPRSCQLCGVFGKCQFGLSDPYQQVPTKQVSPESETSAAVPSEEELAAQVMIEKFHYENGKFDMTLKSAPLVDFLSAAIEDFWEDQGGAENYIYFRCMSPKLGEMQVTVQRASGKTAEQRATELAKEVKVLKRKLAAASTASQSAPQSAEPTTHPVSTGEGGEE